MPQSRDRRLQLSVRIPLVVVDDKVGVAVLREGESAKVTDGARAAEEALAWGGAGGGRGEGEQGWGDTEGEHGGGTAQVGAGQGGVMRG